MLKLVLTLLFILFSSLSLARDSHCLNGSSPIIGAPAEEVVAQRGCCSHHGGVCGCSDGRTVCCDSSFSPSCGCNQEDIKQFLEQNETEIPKS